MRYVNLKAFNFNFTPIATNPFKTASTNSTNEAITVIMNGMFGLLHIVRAGSASKGAYLVLVNSAGQLCTYATPDFVNNSVNNTLTSEPFNVQVSGNTIQWFLSGSTATYKWTIPPFFQANANYIVPYMIFVPANPCGASSFGGTTFLTKQNLVAYEFSNTVGPTGYYYASIYDGQNNFLNGGFINSNSSGADPFNQLNLTLPPGTASTDVYLRNGFRMFAPLGAASYNQQCIGIMQPYLNGDYTQLVCGAATPSVNITALNQVVIFPGRDFGLPDTGTMTSLQIPTGITDWNGYFLIPENTHSMLLSRDWYIDLPALYNSSKASGATGYCVQQDKWFHHLAGTYQTGGTIYINSNHLDLSPYAPVPNFTQSPFKNLANYHRAVSPSGTFQA